MVNVELPGWVSRWLGIAAVVGTGYATLTGQADVTGLLGSSSQEARELEETVDRLTEKVNHLEARQCDLLGLTVEECLIP